MQKSTLVENCSQAGASRRQPKPRRPPINPTLVYPWRRLRDWGFGARRR